jgi:hypothetical protein
MTYGLTIKVKGAGICQALSAGATNVHLLGTALAGSSSLIGTAKIGACTGTLSPALGLGVSPQSSTALAALPKAVAVKAVHPAALSMVGGGTIWSGTGISLGLGLGLGVLGPVLLVSALALSATGAYLYYRCERTPREGSP